MNKNLNLELLGASDAKKGGAASFSLMPLQPTKDDNRRNGPNHNLLALGGGRRDGARLHDTTIGGRGGDHDQTETTKANDPSKMDNSSMIQLLDDDDFEKLIGNYEEKGPKPPQYQVSSKATTEPTTQR